MRKNKKGFSLVEIIIAVAIMALLTAVLVPTFITYLNNARESKDQVKFDSMVTAFKSVLSEDEIRRDLEKKHPDVFTDGTDLFLDFDIVDGYIDFKSGRLHDINHTEIFENCKLGLNSYQSIGTEYQMEQTTVKDGLLRFTIIPKTSKTTVSVTYEITWTSED